MVGVHVKPHDLIRHAATYASRSGTPLEIVSKGLLRHSNISTTQRYLGKISDVEAMRWIDNLHGEFSRWPAWGFAFGPAISKSYFKNQGL